MLILLIFFVLGLGFAVLAWYAWARKRVAERRQDRAQAVCGPHDDDWGR